MAKIIAFNKSFEPLDIELGDETVHARIDLRDSSVNKNWELLRSSREKMEAIQEASKALESACGPEADKIAKDMADLMRPAICGAIGEQSYLEILVACGDGEPVQPEEANMVMALVFSEIEVAIIDRIKAFKDHKAAHYLKEIANAQPEPHKA
ncbi:MAG: hypothetical protein MEEGG_02817 [Eggerthella lenta]|jgi:hypothetical protein